MTNLLEHWTDALVRLERTSFCRLKAIFGVCMVRGCTQRSDHSRVFESWSRGRMRLCGRHWLWLNIRQEATRPDGSDYSRNQTNDVTLRGRA